MNASHSEDLDYLCEQLKTTELENEEIVLEANSISKVVDKGKHCILLKLLTSKYCNREAFKATMRRAWRPTKSLQFHEMGEGLLMVEFELQSDKAWVMNYDPWSFNKNLILMKNFDSLQQVKAIHIMEAVFWIRVYDLPLIARNTYVGSLIGNAIGKLEGIDLDHGEVEWGEFMRIRVTIDITKPLMRRKKLNIGLAESVWLSFKYERLLDHCYCCGMLDHGHRVCKKWLEAAKVYEKIGLPYENVLHVGLGESLLPLHGQHNVSSAAPRQSQQQHLAEGLRPLLYQLTIN